MKQPSWKVPLILSGTLLAVGTFAYWLQYSHKPKKDKEETASKKPLFLPSEKTQIAQFRMKSTKILIEGKCDDLAAKKCGIETDGKWTISHPQTLKGDTDNIHEFISGAANALATQTIDLTEETPEKRKSLLDEYGLSDAKRTDISTQFIEFVLEDGKRLTMWFGIDHPLGEKTFVVRAENGTIDDKTIYLLSSFFKGTFDHGLTYFRDKSVFTFGRDSVDAFEAQTTHGKIEAKKVNGLWTVNGYPGDMDRIQSFLAAFTSLKAKEFPDTDPTKGKKPTEQFTLHSGKDTYTLSLFDLKAPTPKGSKLPGKSTFYVKASSRPELLEVESLFDSQVNKKVADLRNGTIMTQTEKVTNTQIRIEGPGFKSPLEFKYDAGKWGLKNPGPKVDTAKVGKLMDQLVSARVTDYVPLPPGKKEQVHIIAGDDKNPSKFNMNFYVTQDRVYGEDLNEKEKLMKLLEPELKMALPFNEDSWKMK